MLRKKKRQTLDVRKSKQLKLLPCSPLVKSRAEYFFSEMVGELENNCVVTHTHKNIVLWLTFLMMLIEICHRKSFILFIIPYVSTVMQWPWYSLSCSAQMANSRRRMRDLGYCPRCRGCSWKSDCLNLKSEHANKQKLLFSDLWGFICIHNF